MIAPPVLPPPHMPAPLGRWSAPVPPAWDGLLVAVLVVGLTIWIARRLQ